MFVYIYIYIYMYIYICQDSGAVGFVEFTKLLFAFASLAQPFNRVRSIPEHVFVILSQRKACAGSFRKETAGKRTGPITRWPPRRLLFTRLEIAFVTISLFTIRTKVVHKVFQEGWCGLEALISFVFGLQLKCYRGWTAILLTLAWFCTWRLAVSFGAILSSDSLDFGQQISVCVDGIIQGKATE